MPAPRVVSLVPSATETLLAIGADVVACTRFCEQPDLPHVGGTKNPDIDAIVALAPDLVVVDEEENRREDADALAAAGLELLVLAVRSVEARSAAVAELARRSDRAQPQLTVPPPVPVRLRAFVPIWRRPWMTINGDTYGASVLRTVGIELVTATSPDTLPDGRAGGRRRAGARRGARPERAVLVHRRHVDELRAAFPGVAVELVDGQDLFWWGTRTPGAIERLRPAAPATR